ncbi:hypothetical protein GWI33_009793 [Rhynchophorus ferrugineus]|uniref:RRM domain-containing protein n=1 Tax=Rhynchophorus ferrugineus TaxID=354439 RepID=A0A834IT16_RHYFE|nr:hypothetical protein GWI33_009793 [Rhynchophorus ferrugineus]
MNVFQKCPSSWDLEPLYLPQQLYLRRVAKLVITLQLPNVKKLGKSVSHWEIMDKLRELIKPEEFIVLKVTKTTIECVCFEAEIEKRSKLDHVITKVDNKTIKLKDFSDLMRVRATQFKSEFPTARIWDAYFSEAKDMDERKPGEKPDTVHIANLPSKWFIPYHLLNDEYATPSEKMLYKIFEQFGSVRNVDVPICDPYRNKMKAQISGLKYSSFDQIDWFEGYIQFEDYKGFTAAMDSLRDRKLVHKEEDGNIEVELKVDFDKTKHLSDASIKRREIVRDRLVKKAKEKEEQEQKELDERKRIEEAERKKEEDIKEQKEQRRRMREEKRKAKLMKTLEISESDEINDKIAKEEKKLIKAQRKLEAIRLVEELFRRIKEKNYVNTQRYNILDRGSHELKQLKNHSELNFLSQKEKLHNAVKGRVILKTILTENEKKANYSESSDTELSLDEDPKLQKAKKHPLRGTPHLDLFPEDGPSTHPMYSFPYPPLYPFPGPLFPDIDIFSMYRGRRRGFRSNRGGRGRGRGGFNSRGRDNSSKALYTTNYDDYSRRNRKLSRDYDRRSSRSRSSTRRRTYIRSRSHSYSRKSRSRTKSRSRSRRRFDRRHDSRSSSRDARRKSRSRTRDRSRSKIRKFRSMSRSRSRGKSCRSRRSRSNTRSRENL